MKLATSVYGFAVCVLVLSLLTGYDAGIKIGISATALTASVLLIFYTSREKKQPETPTDTPAKPTEPMRLIPVPGKQGLYEIQGTRGPGDTVPTLSSILTEPDPRVQNTINKPYELLTTMCLEIESLLGICTINAWELDLDQVQLLNDLIAESRALITEHERTSKQS